MGDSTWDDLSNMSGVTSYEELGDRFKAAFDRIKRADASFPEPVLQEFPLVLSDLDVERIAVSQGWQDEFLRPATPPPAAPSRNIQEFIRRQQQQQVAVPTPARAAPPGPVRQAPPSAVRMSIASVASPASIGRPSIASPAAEPAAPAAVSKAAPPAPPAALPAQPAAPAALPAQPAAPAPLPAAPAALPADPPALPANPAALPADPVPEEIPAPPVPAEGEGVPPDDDDNALVCAICQDIIRTGDRVRKLNCPHSFHDECMEGWFRVTRDYTLRCPMRCAQ